MRCPGSVIGDADQVTRSRVQVAMRHYMQLDAHGVLPERGGWLDQSPSFAAFCSVVDQERGRWERVRAETLAKRR
jgi:hypothetical protein